MSLPLRKSVYAGPYRFQASKSRIGFRLAMRGLRLGYGPRGHYIQAGAKGFEYRASIGCAGEWIPLTPLLRAARPTPHGDRVDTVPIENGVLEMSAERLEDLVAEIKRKHGQFRVSTLLAWSSACSALALGFELSNPLVLASVPVAYLLGRWLDTYQRTTVLYYDLEPGVERAFAAFVQSFEQMARSQKAWRVSVTGDEREIETWRRHALPRSVRSNLEPPYLCAGKQEIYFFPDFVLVLEGRKASALTYGQLRIAVQPRQAVAAKPAPAAVAAGGAPEAKAGRLAGGQQPLPLAQYDQVLALRPEGFPPKISRLVRTWRALRQAVASYRQKRALRPKKPMPSLPAPVREVAATMPALGKRLATGALAAATSLLRTLAGAARRVLGALGAAMWVSLLALPNGGLRALRAVALALLGTARIAADACRRSPWITATSSAALTIVLLLGAFWLRFDDIQSIARGPAPQAKIIQPKLATKAALPQAKAALPEPKATLPEQKTALPEPTDLLPRQKEETATELPTEDGADVDPEVEASQRLARLERRQQALRRVQRTMACKQSCNRARLGADESGQEFDWSQCYLTCAADQGQSAKVEAGEETARLERQQHAANRIQRNAACKQSCNRVRLVADQSGEEFDWSQCYLACFAEAGH
jgi:hypothetical protein